MMSGVEISMLMTGVVVDCSTMWPVTPRQMTAS